MTYVLFDIGGTKSRMAVTDDLKTFIRTETFTTPNDPTKFVTKIAEFSSLSMKDGPLEGIVGGIRGVLNEVKTGLEHDAILSSWIDFNICEELEKILKAPVILENDTALAGLGETLFGAGQGVDLVAYHTISTGVGGVKITNGHIDITSAGFEPGH